MKRITHSIWLYLMVPALAMAADVTDIGMRRELFVDSSLVETVSGGAELRLHQPVPQELVLEHQEPWEGSGSGYHSVFQDGDRYLMYYKAWNIVPDVEANGSESPPPRRLAYAESDDGIHWHKPTLGLHAFAGRTDNNIVLTQERIGSVELDPAHVAVFLDTNPNATEDARYKAIVRNMHHAGPGLLAMKSADGIHWSLMADEPVITDGRFDSQNLAFWDEVAGCYRAYWRIYYAKDHLRDEGLRGIRTATSQDFIYWENMQDVSYEDTREVALYTNVIKPYPRAPHILLGFPARYVERGHEDKSEAEREEIMAQEHPARVAAWSPEMQALPDREARELRGQSNDRYGAAMSDTVLMTSRDGVHFKRWHEAFLPPGIERPDTWNYGHQYMAWHVVETESALPGAPRELSFYAVESYWTAPGSALRRYTLRLDGFVSLWAPAVGGELLTKPVRFAGNELTLNFATSAAGSVRVEIQDEAGEPIPGFTLADCAPLYGNTIERALRWTGGRELSELAGQPVRLRFVLQDADVYAYRFRE